MKKRKNPDLYVLLLSAIYVALGLVLIIWPETSAMTICRAVGGVIILGGLFYILSYFTRNHYGSVIGPSLAVGLVLVVLGVFVLVRAEAILKAMPFIFGVLLLFDSATKIQTALDLRRLGALRWTAPLAIGAVTAALGLILIWNPFSAVVALNIFIGVCLVVGAVANLTSSLLLARSRREQEQGEDSDQ